MTNAESDVVPAKWKTNPYMLGAEFKTWCSKNREQFFYAWDLFKVLTENDALMLGA